jgi:transglutaminase-like putative cysteine protease
MSLLRRAIAGTVSFALVWQGAWGAASSPWTVPAAAGREADVRLPVPQVRTPEHLPSLSLIRDAAYEVADRYDVSKYFVDDLLTSLDYDPLAAFEFVRDHIRFDPYEGVLRGAEGTLAAQAGNAYDRSLLLKRLLEDMGYEARLVRGTLKTPQAEELLTRATEPAPAISDEIDALAGLVGLSREVRERWLARAGRDFHWLNGALNTTAFDGDSSLLDVRAVLAHVWVEAKIDGQWMDLDSSFRDAKPGDAYAEPESFANDARPDDRHVVRIEVIEELLKGDHLVEQSVLAVKLDAASAAESRIYLTFAPRNASLGGTLTRALGPDLQFVPMLTVDDDRTVGKPIGGVVQNLSEGKKFFYGENREQLTALYLQVRTGAPGGRMHESRRALLDRLSGSARRSEVLSARQIAPLPESGGVPNVFNAVHQLLVSTGAFNLHRAANNVGLAAYFVSNYLLDSDEAKKLPLDSIMWPIAMVRMAQIAVAERLDVAALNDHANLRFLISEPRVYVFSQSMFTSNDDDEVASSIDLMHDVVQAAVSGSVPPNEVARRRMWYGVLQSGFETTLTELPRLVLNATSDGLVSASQQSTGEPILIRDAADKRLPSNASSALLEDLEAGRIIVTSASALGHGAQTWWSLEPDGTTRALLLPGLGGAGDPNWWSTYTNARLPKEEVHTTYRPDMSHDEIMSEQQRAIREALKEVSEKGDYPRHAERVSRAGKLPKTTARSCSGGTEDTEIECNSIAMTLPRAAFFGLVAAAILTVAFVIIYVFVDKTKTEVGEPPKGPGDASP